jgi:tetratricopeptide (TPR) repeat protein
MTATPQSAVLGDGLVRAAEAERMGMANDGAEQAGRLQRSAASLHRNGRWAEAEALAGRASALLDAEPDRPALGLTLQALAATMDDLGDHARAEALYRRAGAILADEAAGGPHDSLRIRCARGLAATLRMQGRSDEANVVLIAGLALAEQLLGPTDIDTLATMTALGLLCEGAGRSAEAEELYRHALARAEAASAPDPDEVAGIAAALAGLLERRRLRAATA